MSISKVMGDKCKIQAVPPPGTVFFLYENQVLSHKFIILYHIKRENLSSVVQVSSTVQQYSESSQRSLYTFVQVSSTYEPLSSTPQQHGLVVQYVCTPILQVSSTVQLSSTPQQHDQGRFHCAFERLHSAVVRWFCGLVAHTGSKLDRSGRVLIAQFGLVFSSTGQQYKKNIKINQDI